MPFHIASQSALCAVIRSAVCEPDVSSIICFYSIVETINMFNIQVCNFGFIFLNIFPSIDLALETKSSVGAPSFIRYVSSLSMISC